MSLASFKAGFVCLAPPFCFHRCVCRLTVPELHITVRLGVSLLPLMYLSLYSVSISATPLSSSLSTAISVSVSVSVSVFPSEDDLMFSLDYSVTAKLMSWLLAVFASSLTFGLQYY
jgi:hypothetical protein